MRSNDETLKQQFLDPSKEFSPIPFWFWNDDLTKEELLRQLHDFHDKEVNGFVLHPRMGLPGDMPYLSDAFMELVEAVVAEAEKLEMKVILYDEGMYPSGSANGLVVKHNPDYASRGLQMREYPCSDAPVRMPIDLSPEETLVSVQAVRMLSETEYDPSSGIVLACVDGEIEFSPGEGQWSVLVFVDTPSRGTIRGIHSGQDDGEPAAPLAADLLRPEAVQTFIDVTHERYYQVLKRYFGGTVIAMFTDEPDLLGRGHVKGLQPWTRRFLSEYIAAGGEELDLPSLWMDAGAKRTGIIRARFEESIRRRLNAIYYKPLSEWCEAHGIALTGHPASSEDIGLLEHFQIPGQDVVWRYIAPENDKAITGTHSTMGKCSSDAARHRGRRRNINEAFGVCGIEGGWTLSADNLKWYLDWLFVRGVNMISPHAFYYSIRGARRDERPPDVGPNNIWWPEYARFSRYIKRMSWLMTDSMNGAQTAVLAGAAYLPWQAARPLYENQIEFNYLEEDLLPRCVCRDGAFEIEGYRYKAVVIEDAGRLTETTWELLKTFVEAGGLVIEQSASGDTSREIGQLRVKRAEDIPGHLLPVLAEGQLLAPAAAQLRISRIMKHDTEFYVIVNEGEQPYDGALRIGQRGRVEIWHPWTGECTAAHVLAGANGRQVAINLARRECLIVTVDPSQSEQAVDLKATGTQTGFTHSIMELSTGWRVLDGPWRGTLPSLASWTEWSGMAHYSGTVTYEQTLKWDGPAETGRVELDLGDVHELVRLSVNGSELGIRMWAPYTFEVGRYLRKGDNVLQVTVTNSLANRYDGFSLPSGLLGPVQLKQ